MYFIFILFFKRIKFLNLFILKIRFVFKKLFIGSLYIIKLMLCNLKTSLYKVKMYFIFSKFYY